MVTYDRYTIYKMRIKPIYQKWVLKQPYIKGFITGLMVGAGLFITLSNQAIVGSITLILGVLSYAIQTSDKYNFNI